jgi:NTE family protein
MTTALVLSGGGSLGAVQVGMVRALIEAGIDFDHVVGTSVGAVNAAWLATHDRSSGDGRRGVDALVEVWKGLRRQDVFPTQTWHGLLAAGGLRPSMVPDSGLRTLLTRHLGDRRLENTPVGLHVVAVDARTGLSIRLSSGPAVESVLASCAIPGILPPVQIGERTYIDGGVVDNCPVRHALDLGADRLWVLPAGYRCAMPSLPATVVGMALHGLTLLVQHGLAQDLERYSDHVALHVAPPLCPLAISPADFSHSEELIDRAHESTAAWLADGAPRLPLAYSHPHPHAEVSASRPEP